MLELKIYDYTDKVGYKAIMRTDKIFTACNSTQHTSTHNASGERTRNVMFAYNRKKEQVTVNLVEALMWSPVFVVDSNFDFRISSNNVMWFVFSRIPLNETFDLLERRGIIQEKDFPLQDDLQELKAYLVATTDADADTIMNITDLLLTEEDKIPPLFVWQALFVDLIRSEVSFLYERIDFHPNENTATVKRYPKLAKIYLDEFHHAKEIQDKVEGGLLTRGGLFTYYNDL